MSHHQAAVYRQRAAALRHLAVRIERTPAMDLERLAGIDTWRGPRPAACVAELRLAQHAVHAAADELRTRAWQFHRRADELEATARATPMTAS